MDNQIRIARKQLSWEKNMAGITRIIKQLNYYRQTNPGSHQGLVCPPSPADCQGPLCPLGPAALQSPLVLHSFGICLQ